MTMRWLKWYAIDWINSTARDELTPAERSTWVDFVSLARFPGSTPGTFKFASYEALARKLNTPLDVILSTRDKCLVNRITLEETSEGLVMTILNWDKYQARESDNAKRAKPTKTDNKNRMQRRGEGRGVDPHPTPPLGVPPHSLEGWIERIRTAGNAVSELGEMLLLLSDGKQTPDYARLGKMAKGDPGYIVGLIWRCAGARPDGNWLDYIQGILRKKVIEEPDLGTRLREY